MNSSDTTAGLNMFISYEKKIIFVHVPKTAGTSIRTALKNTVADDAHNLLLPDVRRRLREARPGLGLVPPHLSIKHLNFFDIDVEDFDVFVSVRDPVERFVSLFNYITKNNTQHALHQEAKRAGFEKTVEYLIRVQNEYPERLPQHWFYQTNSFLENSHFIRTERIENDIKPLLKKIGLNPESLPHENSSQNSPIKISERIRNLILDHENVTCRLFGYDYSAPKTA